MTRRRYLEICATLVCSKITALTHADPLSAFAAGLTDGTNRHPRDIISLITRTHFARLSEQLDTIDKMTRPRMVHKVAVVKDDRPVFLFVNGVPAEDFREQVSLLLTDLNRRFVWSRANGAGGDSPQAHVLRSERVTDRQIGDWQLEAAREQCKFLKQVLSSSPEQFEELMKDDPDTAVDLSGPIARKNLRFFFALPPSVMEAAYRGKQVRIPVASMPESLRSLLRESFEGQIPDEAIAKTGEYVVTASPYREIPSKLIMGLQEPDGTIHGYGVFGGWRHEEREPQRQAVRERKEQEISAELAERSKVPTVTIARDCYDVAGEEPPLAGYLRSFAEQTGYSVYGAWSPTDKVYRKPLQRSVVKKPLAEALNYLSRHYKNTRWVADGAAIRFWAGSTKLRRFAQAEPPMNMSEIPIFNPFAPAKP